MALNLKESLKYGVLSVFVNLFHLCDIFIMSPCRGLHNLITVTPKSKVALLEKSFRGKNCIVTGGSSGIGMELALLLSSLGANVIISSRKLDMLELVATRCRLLHPKAVIIPIVLDLEKYENIAEYTAQVMDKLQKNNLPQKIDVLINNAGLSSRGAAMDTSMATLEKMMGKIGIPYRTSYAASKHALQGYFDGLRSELADKKITVTTVSPGYVNTSLSLNALNADGTKYNKTDETTANGMSPSELSERILLNMANGVADIVIADAKTCVGILLKVLMPQLFASMMKKRIGK